MCPSARTTPGGDVRTRLRQLRRRLLTPSMSETLLSVRGFHVKSPQARDRLESIGRFFLTGYGEAAQARRPRDVEAALEAISPMYQGFAYEGAAMGHAVRDGLPVGGRDHVAGFLAGRADRHIYMAYVGVGWAMARLPRMRWGSLHAPDPLLRWLVLDGYGFHQAYFRTSSYVHKHYVEQRFPWPGDRDGHAARVIDQGIGRACWFVGGADPEVVARLLHGFPGNRQADLWAGAGLAATYAGAAEQAELERFWELAGPYRRFVAQGAAFAAAARVRADLVVPHNELATEVFCGMDAAAATKVTDEARAGLPPGNEIPQYAAWRDRIIDAFAAAGRV
ncbi:MAG: DUF1702 family protein [Actinomycetota bacterium]|nr:DUF1702 family protein [Actinomycetota bacterium]